MITMLGALAERHVYHVNGIAGNHKDFSLTLVIYPSGTEGGR
jgi:hypothetical protein